MNKEDREKLRAPALGLQNLLVSVCDINGVRIRVSNARLLEVVGHFQKDLVKLEYHQGDRKSLNKLIAGLAFWVRRLKPIIVSATKDSNAEVNDINEQAAVWMMHELLLHYCDSNNVANSVQQLPMRPRSSHLENYLGSYWSLDKNFNYTSLIYNLRYRNISPHHMALLLDSIMSGFVLKHTMSYSAA